MNTIKDISQNVLYKNLILYTNLQQSLILKYKAYSSSDKTSGNVDSVARIWNLIVHFYIKNTQLPLTKESRIMFTISASMQYIHTVKFKQKVSSILVDTVYEKKSYLTGKHLMASSSDFQALIKLTLW